MFFCYFYLLFGRVDLTQQAAISTDPSLATSRHLSRATFPMDGWTPLHAAAAKGNKVFVEVDLFARGVGVGACCFSRLLQSCFERKKSRLPFLLFFFFLYVTPYPSLLAPIVE